MNRILRSEDMLQRWAVVLLLMAVPAFAWGQKKTESAPKAAPQRSAPAKAAPSRPAAVAWCNDFARDHDGKPWDHAGEPPELDDEPRDHDGKPWDHSGKPPELDDESRDHDGKPWDDAGESPELDGESRKHYGGSREHGGWPWECRRWQSRGQRAPAGRDEERQSKGWRNGERSR